ncbi:hypothetical protein BT93_B0703 [Corymbia citriodora subsp. variegata]|nr:hypothetical protein BT93_B0703 [Corymbia citriodora subsp. variegata]KAF8037937.1 hypothetical protein BT93_B0703 [Corymbia citriodora subsp. variegata]
MQTLLRRRGLILCFVALFSHHESLTFATMYFDVSLQEDGHPRPFAAQLSREGKSRHYNPTKLPELPSRTRQYTGTVIISGLSS